MNAIIIINFYTNASSIFCLVSEHDDLHMYPSIQISMVCSCRHVIFPAVFSLMSVPQMLVCVCALLTGYVCVISDGTESESYKSGKSVRVSD